MAGVLSVYSNPIAKGVLVKTVAITRSMTAATEVAKLPRGANIIALVLSGTASNAGTTATLSFGTTSAATELVNAQSVLAAGAGDGVQVLKGVSSAVGQAVLANDTRIYAKYAETGIASSAGSWVLHVIYADVSRAL